MTTPKNEKGYDQMTREKLIETAKDKLNFYKEYKKFNPNEAKDLYQLSIALTEQSNFTYSRRLLQLLYLPISANECLDEFEKDIVKNLAIVTYKDADLSSKVKFKFAEALLLKVFQDTNDPLYPNILGLLGSIYKKKWTYENHDGHLFKSLRYYLNGFEKAKKNKDVSNIDYCGINLAFIYDQLASLKYFQPIDTIAGITIEEKEDQLKKLAIEYTNKAKRVRHFLVNTNHEKMMKIFLEKKNKKDWFWPLVTQAEAHLGLGNFEKSVSYYNQALALSPSNWKKQSATKQCIALIDTLYKDQPEILSDARFILKVLLDVNYFPKTTEKIGLALSGGGFRASLFHIGVLAKLADADLLRKVEVISCVSGGSILGAFYYLKLKNLIAKKGFKKLTKQDYIDLVKKVETEFLTKINHNIRHRIFANIFQNARIAFSKTYTRTNRTEDLFDEFLYDKSLTGKKSGEFFMNDLMIKPNGKPYSPNQENWKHENKVPIIILNATSLNTGHAWQFTSTWMGESPAYINDEYDALPHLRRMYYWEAPTSGVNFNNIKLSRAVAASAGVPGVFAPVEFRNLYPDTNLLLVDGGVHDNQGLNVLYEQECNNLFISDASGQMPATDKPANNELNVINRTNTILQDRIRNNQLRDLEGRKKSGVIRDFKLMHLTKGIDGGSKDWTDCKDPFIPPQLNRETVDKKKEKAITIQKLLAKIRTDLDVFHEHEAYALIYNGYKMTGEELKDKVDGKDIIVSDKWDFLKIEDKFNDENSNLENILAPSSKLFGKINELNSSIKYISILILFSVFFTIAFLAIQLLQISSLTLIQTGVVIYIIVFLSIILIGIERLLSYIFSIKSLFYSSTLLSFLTVVFIGLKATRKFSTKSYLKAGKIK